MCVKIKNIEISCDYFSMNKLRRKTLKKRFNNVEITINISKFLIYVGNIKRLILQYCIMYINNKYSLLSYANKVCITIITIFTLIHRKLK